MLGASQKYVLLYTFTLTISYTYSALPFYFFQWSVFLKILFLLPSDEMLSYGSYVTEVYFPPDTVIQLPTHVLDKSMMLIKVRHI